MTYRQDRAINDTKDLELLVWQGPEENGPSKTDYAIYKRQDYFTM